MGWVGGHSIVLAEMAKRIIALYRQCEDRQTVRQTNGQRSRLWSRVSATKKTLQQRDMDYRTEFVKQNRKRTICKTS